MPRTRTEAPKSLERGTQRVGRAIGRAIDQAYASFGRKRVALETEKTDGADKRVFLHGGVRDLEPVHNAQPPLKRGRSDPASGSTPSPVEPEARSRRVPKAVNSPEVRGAAHRREIELRERSAEDLANLELRRTFRDRMVEQHGENAAAAVFKEFGQALKGEGKFVPLDAETQLAMSRHAQARTSQAHKGVCDVLDGIIPGGRGGLELVGELAGAMATLREALEGHPKYGREFFNTNDLRIVALSVEASVKSKRPNLCRDIRVEEYIAGICREHFGSLPVSLGQALEVHQAAHPVTFGAARIDQADIRRAFRAYSLKKTCHPSGYGQSFIREYIASRLGSRAFMLLSYLLPRDLAYYIASAVQAILYRQILS